METIIIRDDLNTAAQIIRRGGLVGVEGDDPFEGRLSVEAHAAHPLHDGERVEQLPLHERRNLLRRQGAADAVADGGLRLLAVLGLRDGLPGLYNLVAKVVKLRLQVGDFLLVALVGCPVPLVVLAAGSGHLTK